ncbi:MAG TPA: alpha/beta fold hydrolase [Vicinamibacterales bacterium]|nr:alpha/beta fold hydrolase [Vicinamibacterales bacterium]
MKRWVKWLPALLVSVPFVAGAGVPSAKRVTFQSGGHSLVGFLYQPEGAGPWPALIWNHGSEKDPGAGRQFDTVASIFAPAGYVVFAPERRGHGDSSGEYVVDRVKAAFSLQGKDAANRLTVHLLETEQLDDQLAALGYVSRLPFVDPERVVVAGCSYGGIETLLGAESRAGYKAAVSISPAALSWDRNDYLQARLVKAVSRIRIPVLLIQPAKDASLAPSHVLGVAATRAGTPMTVKVYPATGPAKEQSHCFGGASGMHVWAEDAKAFLEGNLLKRDQS